jgi:hypothetical protein
MPPVRTAKSISRRGLIERHGRDMTLPDVALILAADCRRQQTVSIHDRCGVYFPHLAAPSHKPL